MKFPESTESIRSAGNMRSRSRLRTRGSMNPAVERSSNGTSRQRDWAAIALAFCWVRYFSRGLASTASMAVRASCAANPESPSTPRSMGRLAPSEESSTSTWTTLVPAAIRWPWRMVHIFSVQPQPTMRSAPLISSAVSGEEKPPEMPRLNGSPLKRPFATAEVPTSAPECSASARISWRAPRPPRPAMNTGRSAARSSSTSSRADCGSGRIRETAAMPTADTASVATPAWTSNGRLRTTVRRSFTAVRNARTVSAMALSGEWIRSATAPTLRARASWSTLKLERIAAA